MQSQELLGSEEITFEMSVTTVTSQKEETKLVLISHMYR